MTKVYCYARVSTDKQENSAEAQQARLLEYAQKSGMELGRLFIDIDVSARDVPLAKRPEGKLLCDALQPGDHVVFCSISRGFRQAAECIWAFSKWYEQGIIAHLLDMQVDMGTPMGRAIVGYMAVGAQLESDLHSQRKKEVYAHRRSLGLPVQNMRPYGWVTTKGPNGKLTGWAECHEERKWGDLALALRREGKSWSDITLHLCHAGAQKPVRKKGSHSCYHAACVRALVRAAEAGYPRRSQASWLSPDSEPTPVAS
jgi:DNA invertase Pin-like site-specific DNA recombinase